MASRKKDKSASTSQEKPNAPRKRKSKKSSSFWTYFLPLLVVLTLLPIVLVYLVFSQRILPEVSDHFKEKNQLVLSLYTTQLDQKIDTLITQLQGMTKLDSLQQQLGEASSPTLFDTKTGDNSGIQNVILFPRGNHRPDPDAEPSVSFIMINNALTATRTGEANIEIEGDYLYITSQVRSPDDKVLGAATAIMSKAALFAAFGDSINSDIAIQIQQVIDQSVKTVYESKSWSKDVTATYDEKFKDVFRLRAHWLGGVNTSITSEYLLLALGLASGLISALLLYIVAMIYNQALKRDLEITRDAVIDLFRGKKPTKEHFQLQVVADTYENIYDNLKNSAAIIGSAAGHHTSELAASSLFQTDVSRLTTEPVPAPKSNFSREQTAMDIVDTQKVTPQSATPQIPLAKSPSSSSSSNGAESASGAAMPQSIFRAYDIRGIYPQELNETTIELIGQAIGTAAIEAGTREITIARDGRISGPTLIKAMRKGLKKTGIVIIDIGMVPTPMLYFAAANLTQGSGVMLTGSHNPPDYNGLKIMIAGETLYGDKIQALYHSAVSGQFAKGTGQVIDKDILDDYRTALLGDIVLSKTLNVVVDCGNGVTGAVLPELFEQLGVNTTGLFTEVDGTFPNHAPDPSQPKNMESLIEAVKASGADLGLGFDGDGDRVGVITPSGQMVYADKLMMLFAEHVLAANPGQEIIYDVKCSSDLAHVIRANGGQPTMWKTGHSLIKAKLRETNAPLAGEMSGHIFFNDRWNGYDDALYAAARLMEMLSTTTENLDELLAHYPNRVSTPELHVDVTDQTKFDIIKKLVAHGNFGNGKANEIDGLRVDFEKGWGLLRASNTTPVLVARFEAESLEVMQMIQGIFRKNLQAVAPDLKISF